MKANHTYMCSIKSIVHINTSWSQSCLISSSSRATYTSASSMSFVNLWMSWVFSEVERLLLRWWDPITLTLEINFLSTLPTKWDLTNHYSDNFCTYPVSTIHITQDPTIHPSPTATLTQGIGPRPLLFWTPLLFWGLSTIPYQEGHV